MKKFIINNKSNIKKALKLMNNSTSPYGTCELNEEGHLKRINEKLFPAREALIVSHRPFRV